MRRKTLNGMREGRDLALDSENLQALNYSI